jgi:anaphase-promoting complex subunit 6
MYHLPDLRPRLFLLAHDLVERGPDNAVSWYAVGLWYFAGRRWDEARRFLGKAVLLDSRFGPAWIAFAHSYALEGEHDQAITAYSTAQRHFPGTHLPVLFIGMQHLHLANLSLAKEYLGAAWEMCPSDPLLANELGVSAYLNDECVRKPLGGTRLTLGSPTRAVELLTKALDLSKEVQCSAAVWAPTHLNLGHALRKLGCVCSERPPTYVFMPTRRRHDEAIHCYQTAIDLDPRVSGPYVGLAYVLLALGDCEGAIARLHEALARTPADPVASDLLRLALEDSAGNTDPAALPGLSARVAADLDREVAKMFSGILAPGVNGAIHEDGPEAGDGTQEMSMMVEDESM